MDSQSDGQLDVVDPGVTLSDGEQSPIVPKLSRLNAPLPPPPNENEVMSEDDGGAPSFQVVASNNLTIY